MLLSHWNYRLDIREYTVHAPDLSPAHDGYRLCFLSDMHIGSINGLDDQLLGHVRHLDYDLIALGGDHFVDRFKSGDWADFASRLTAAAKAPVVSVFGNHDAAPMPDVFAHAGIQSIEGTFLELPGQGQDDANGLRIYGAAFNRAALDGLTNGVRPAADRVNILLTHSPDFARAAADCGFDLFLCGHTHAGQVCLPGGRMIIRKADAPRFVCKGTWNLGGMAGLTSSGVGTSVLPIRLNCPPEIAMLTFRRGPEDQKGAISISRNPGRSGGRTSASSAS